MVVHIICLWYRDKKGRISREDPLSGGDYGIQCLHGSGRGPLPAKPVSFPGNLQKAVAKAASFLYNNILDSYGLIVRR